MNDYIKNISVGTIIFGILTLVIGWLSVGAMDKITMIQMRQIAIVFLVLFFYSLTMDKIDDIEKKPN